MNELRSTSRMRSMGLFVALLLMGATATSAALAAPLPSEKERKLLELESQVSALEQKAFELKQKINTISDKIFKKKFNQGSPKLSVYHSNKMAGYFHIVSVKYTLIKGSTRRELASKTTTVKNKLANQFRVFQGTVGSGRYILEVRAKIRGYNPILTYINNYKIELKNRLPLRANNGRLTSIGVEFADTRGKDVSKRLRIIFRVTR